MKHFLLASAAAMIAVGFENAGERVDTVFVKGADGEPLRVNKSDFDADQAGDKPQYVEYKGKVADEQRLAANELPNDLPPMAAPSAPDFTGGDSGEPLPIDPLKGAVAPTHHGENSRLVIKEGKKYYAVDGQTGNKLTTEQLAGAENGFASEELAWTAIRALPH